MRNAIAIAHDGTRQNEVPIGALVVRGSSIIAGAKIAPCAIRTRRRTPD